MAKSKSRAMFEPGDEMKFLKILQQMELDNLYNTESSYVANTDKYPNNVITFAEKHMEHLKKYPNLDPNQYISNLKLMTKSFVS